MNSTTLNAMLVNSLRDAALASLNSPRYANTKFTALISSVLQSNKFRRTLKAAEQLFGENTGTAIRKTRKLKRGRKARVATKKASAPVDPNAPKPKRGRPKGSKNKPKVPPVVATPEMAATAPSPATFPEGENRISGIEPVPVPA